MDAPSSVQGAVAFTFVVTVASIHVVWLLIFLVRCWLASGSLYAEAQNKTRELEDALKARPNEKLDALNEVFAKTRGPGDATVTNQEQYDKWKPACDEHRNWIPTVITGGKAKTERTGQRLRAAVCI
jgi:hypothetical protein